MFGFSALSEAPFSALPVVGGLNLFASIDEAVNVSSTEVAAVLLSVNIDEDAQLNDAVSGLQTAVGVISESVNFNAVSDDERFVFVRGAVRGVAQQADPVGLGAVGDPHFGAADDVVVAIAPRAGLERRHI